jgi:hypothetical protein
MFYILYQFVTYLFTLPRSCYFQLYTPSGQTPFTTPYHIPHATQTLWYGQHTPSHRPAHYAEGFLHPGSFTPSHRTPTLHIQGICEQVT